MANDIKRLNYFTGQFLEAQDFQDEQKYHIEMRRRLNRLLYSPGAVENGFEVEKIGDKRIRINAGFAIDALGQELFLTTLLEKDIDFKSNAVVYVALCYHQETTDSISEKDFPGEIRITEQPAIQFLDKAPEGDDAGVKILIAKLELDGNGNIKIIDMSVRQMANIKVGGRLGIGTTSPASKLTVAASLQDGESHIMQNVANSGITIECPNEILDKYMPGLVWRTTDKNATKPKGGIWLSEHFNGSKLYLGTSNNWTTGITNKALTINHDGNVGIGTTDPGNYRLKVAGTLNVTGDVSIDASSSLSFGSTTRQMINLFSSGYGIGVQANTQYFRTNQNFAWYKGGAHNDTQLDPGKNGTVQMVIKDGNVGIGTTEPLSALSVVGGLAVGGTYAKTNAAPADGLLVEGSVGIGISSPKKRLHIESGELRIKASHNETTADIAAFYANNLAQGIGIGYNRIQAIGNNKDQDILLEPKGTGSVSIGTSSALSFGSTTRQMINLWKSGYGIGVQDYTQYFRTEQNFAWYKGGAHNDGQLDPGKNGTVQMVIKDGNVGIGTTDPGSLKLKVEGDAYITGKLWATTQLFHWADGGWRALDNKAGNMTGNVPNQSAPSDLRFKTDFRPILSALDKVLKLHGKYYRWGEEGLNFFTRNISKGLIAGPNATEEDNQKLWETERLKAYKALSGDQIGLIAQDLETVVPELVTEDEEGYKYIDYQHLIALLVEAIKEQNEQIKALALKVAS
ncbi:hypothetical protein W03_10340 [Nitrosomonas sp. PY1]|uniref:tail fiber domain-containing protein n=1 Tax=Nitrosomonas sp. PY1 TaxID=1803906 RepID=UPI001FC85F20|nr:tail fiber domain-containing protein [Nitrosomonas sp. PY1]GKS69030.1 hypothetical protein W03_10340 [Nitrosomonas sp. PY1]